MTSWLLGSCTASLDVVGAVLDGKPSTCAVDVNLQGSFSAGISKSSS